MVEPEREIIRDVVYNVSECMATHLTARLLITFYVDF